MLEIFGIIALCKLNKKNAIARGRRPGGYIALTISLWVGLEILGAFVAGVYSGITGNELGYGYLFFAYGFAGIGALISFLCAKFGPKVMERLTHPLNAFLPIVISSEPYIKRFVIEVFTELHGTEAASA